MMPRPDHLFAQARAQASALAAAMSMLLIAAGSAWPQTAPPTPSLGVQEPAQQSAPPLAAPVPPSPAPAGQENPGLINEIGKMFEKSLSILPPLKSPSETIDDLNARAKDATKDASEGLSRLAKPASMVSGRAICPVSANGAPDCKLGADKLRQSKGYKEGKSLTTDSAEACSAKVLIPGRARKPDDCRTDNYVTRALCQQ
ncbi:MAG TPA: hypothetical protein VN926_00920 [Bradyrhizobium sp.]|jgi:hypothetical protein|nr:hypothetical protein [Bradyrhizobium sp.]